jgi:hypothetical protein
MPQSLTAPKAKTHRAEIHLQDLDREVRTFLDREPYEVVGEIEAETGDKVYRWHRDQPFEAPCGA